MKKEFLLCISVCFLLACSKDPNACECGKNMMKNAQEQDQDLLEACEEKAAALPESKQLEWYNQSMECMNEQ